MMNRNQIDIQENRIYELGNKLLAVLLKDRSSGKNIIWATDHYAHRGFGYQSRDEMTIGAIAGDVVKPRMEKSQKEQNDRIRFQAEVFTPSWVCNKQNNLVDNAWFGADNAFNTEQETTWFATETPICFPTTTGRTWQAYVTDVRLEITCGEAPYLVSRYDAVSGEAIALSQRIGMLDRKLRVVCENTDSEEDWLLWATKAYQSTYGYDWQGDNVLLARENLLLTFIDYYKYKFGKEPQDSVLLEIAEIVSWNIWQMDGLKFVIPGSCEEAQEPQISLFAQDGEKALCPGCANNDPYGHTGIYCMIQDWKHQKQVSFVSALRQD